MEQSKYEMLGASASKAGLHSELKNIGMDEQGALFARVNPDLAGDPNYVSFVHCDGAGTKSIVAYLLYKMTGDVKVFGGLAQDALVMNLDDIFCIGIPDSLILSNMIARNSRYVKDDAIGVIIGAYKALCEELSKIGINITLGGGETADVGDLVGTLMVDAVMCGRMPKERLISTERIAPGDVIIGLSNTGMTSYENRPNSSIGSNGLTLARYSLLSRKCAEDYPEVCDVGKAPSLSYAGKFLVTETASGLNGSIGEALLSPTRTYAPVLAKIYTELGTKIHGIIHNTGGGQTKVIRFGRGNIYVKDNLFDTPPLFKLIQEGGNISWKEMFQVFNMGHRMELYVRPEDAATVIEVAKAFSVEAKQIGHVDKNLRSDSINQVIIDSPHGCFNYTL